MEGEVPVLRGPVWTLVRTGRGVNETAIPYHKPYGSLHTQTHTHTHTSSQTLKLKIVCVCFFKGESRSRVFNGAEKDNDTNVPTSVNGAEY